VLVLVVLVLLWQLESPRVQRRAALAGCALCLLALGGLSFALPMDREDEFFPHQYISKFARSRVVAAVDLMTSGVMEADAVAPDRLDLNLANAGACDTSRKLPHIVMVFDESSFDATMLPNVKVPPAYQELFASSAGASGDNTVALPVEVFQGAFMGDASPAAAAVVHSVLRPQPYRTFTDALDDEAYRSLGLPLHYVLSQDDVALPPGEYGWSRFAERIKVSPVPVPGSHESMFTRPAELAAALEQAATS